LLKQLLPKLFHRQSLILSPFALLKDKAELGKSGLNWSLRKSSVSHVRVTQKDKYDGICRGTRPAACAFTTTVFAAPNGHGVQRIAG
jgi:hypothetical protein